MDASDADTDSHVTSHNPLDFATSPPIRVAVGTGAAAQDFFVHEHLIRSRSEFFSHALNGSWKEADERVVPLPDDEPEIFAAYLEALYLNKLSFVDRLHVGPMYLTLSKLYVLAEKLIDDSTKRLVLAVLEGHDNERTTALIQARILPEIDSIRVIYSGTPIGSPARERLVELYVYWGQEQNLTTASPSRAQLKNFAKSRGHEEMEASVPVSEGIGANDFPKDFLYDLCIGMMRMRG